MLRPDKLRSAVTATGRAGRRSWPDRSGRCAKPVAGAALLSVKPGRLQAVRHGLWPTRMFAAGTTLDQADLEDCDALLLPGGAVNAGRLRIGAAVQSVIEQATSAGRPVAVICHAAGTGLGGPGPAAGP